METHPTRLWEPTFAPALQMANSGRLVELVEAEQQIDKILADEKALILRASAIEDQIQPGYPMMLEITAYAYRMAAMVYNRIGEQYLEQHKKSENLPLVTHAIRVCTKAYKWAEKGNLLDLDCQPMLIGALYSLGFGTLMQGDQQQGVAYLTACINQPLPPNEDIPIARQGAYKQQQSARKLLSSADHGDGGATPKPFIERLRKWLAIIITMILFIVGIIIAFWIGNEVYKIINSSTAAIIIGIIAGSIWFSSMLNYLAKTIPSIFNTIFKK